MKSIFFCTLLFAVSCLLFASPANAQSLGIGIFPPVLQIDTTPPASIKANITVQNRSDQNATYQIFLEPFTAGGKYNGEPVFDSALLREYKHIFSRIQITDGTHVIQNLELAPKQKKSIVMHIGLPKGEKPQDYYFSVLFIYSPEKQTAQRSASGARGGIGTNVLLSIGPKSPAQGQISQFSTSSFQTQGPVKFSLRVQNSGKSYFAPKGNVLVRDMFGKIVGQIDLLPVNVLSDSQRLIPSVSNSDKESPKVVWSQKFLLGFYTATANLALTERGPQVTKTTTFFAFPVEGILGFGALLLLVLWIWKRATAKQREES